MQDPSDSVSSSDPIRTSYDEVPYFSKPFSETHPDHLATKARILGLTPPAPDRCRVLELGCAAGGNLVPMALTMPGSEFVGVDLSSVQIAEGVKLIADLGLKNIRLVHASIADVDESFGQFDYIVSHGVYSWVPTTVQEKMLAICHRQMNGNGVAYISYNTLPGWHMKAMIRDLMRYHAMEIEDPAERVGQARAILDFLAQAVQQNNAYSMLLKSELEFLRRQPDYYVLHEHLEDINEPIYFHEFVARARRHGLQYLNEAGQAPAPIGAFRPESLNAIFKMAQDNIRQEQLADFLLNRSFRRTLLVHEGSTIDRMVTPGRLVDLWISSPARAANASPDVRSERPVDFKTPVGMGVRVQQPIVKAAFSVLARCWPAAAHFGDVVERAAAELGWHEVPAEEAERVASVFGQCYMTRIVELHSSPSPFVVEAGATPRASALARRQAAAEAIVTNLRHESVRLSPAARALLPLLDGALAPASLVGSPWPAAAAEANPETQAPSQRAGQTWTAETIRDATREIATLALLQAT